MTTTIHGAIDPAFASLRTSFQQQFDENQHVGAAVAVYHHGRLVADLWAGVADEATNEPWREDTMALVYSATKGLTATCVHVLASRGLIDHESPVAQYWPEFAANGKQDITVAQLMSHQAGVPQLPDGLISDDLLDWERMVAGIALLEPAWEPGTDTGYHALTFGYLAGELVRRVDGRSVGAFLRDEIAAPLGLTQLHIGTTPDIEPRIAKLISRADDNIDRAAGWKQIFDVAPLIARAISPPDGRLNDVLDSPAGHQAEVPAVNAVASARDLARLYACLANGGELDGVRIMSEQTVRTMSERRTHRADKILFVPVGWSLGYMTGGDDGRPQGARLSAFGHVGFGGSMGFCDPEINMSFGLVLNLLDRDLLGAGRTAALAEAARTCAERADAGA